MSFLLSTLRRVKSETDLSAFKKNNDCHEHIKNTLSPFLIEGMKKSHSWIFMDPPKDRYFIPTANKTIEIVDYHRINDEVIIGINKQHLVIYNEKTGIFQTFLDGSISNLYSLGNNKFAVHFPYQNALKLIEWDGKQLVPIGNKKIEVNPDINEANNGPGVVLKDGRLLLLSHDACHSINSFKTWFGRIYDCNLISSESVLAFTVTRFEHFFPINLFLTDNNIIVGWSDYVEKDCRKLCFIDPTHFAVQSIELPLANHLKITNAIPINDGTGRILIDLSYGLSTLELKLRRNPKFEPDPARMKDNPILENDLKQPDKIQSTRCYNARI